MERGLRAVPSPGGHGSEPGEADLWLRLDCASCPGHRVGACRDCVVTAMLGEWPYDGPGART